VARRAASAYHKAMSDQNGYAAFIEECRAERNSINALIHRMEKGQLGIGMPITLPKVNEATANAVAGMKRTVADLDALIAAYEAEPHA